MKQLQSVFSRANSLFLIVCAFFIISESTPANSQIPTGENSPPIVSLPNFVVEEIITGLELPTGFDFSPDGRIFVAEKSGLIHVFDQGQRHTFADLSGRINSVGDRGLMSVAVHPDFPRTPYVYAAYVHEPAEAYGYNEFGARASQVMRLTARPDNLNAAMPGAGIVILGSNSTFENLGNPGATKAPPYSCLDSEGEPVPDCLPNEDLSHLIDFLRFGPDGALYVSNGDGHTELDVAIRAQDIDSLAGKILRIDPITGQGYPDNPFYDGDPNSNRSKVYAYGLRNPFRFSFHPESGELYVGEVGNDTWEEISRGGPGANFGWPCYEGPVPAAAHLLTCLDLYEDETDVVPSYYYYEHLDGTGAVIGGDFYTGDTYPEKYQGAYFFAEFSFTSIRPLAVDGEAGELINNGLFMYNVQGPVQITAGPDDDLYVLSIVMGTLYQVSYSDTGNQVPIAVAQADITSGINPLTVKFSSAESRDPGGSIREVVWDFGDGTTSTELNPEHVYYLEGVYDVVLKITDDSGTTDTDRLEIRVGNTAPKAQILGPPEGVRYGVGEVIKLSGQGMDDEDGLLTDQLISDGTTTETIYTPIIVTNTVILANGDTQSITRTVRTGRPVVKEQTRPVLEWSALLHHHTHIHYDHFKAEGPKAQFTYPDHGDNSYLEVCLTVTDSGGLEDTECMDLLPKEVNYTFESIPDGLSILYNGTTYVTPFEVTTYVNAERQLALYDYSTSGLYFSEWSDGGDPDHKVIIEPTDQVLTVTYTDEPPSDTSSAATTAVEPPPVEPTAEPISQPIDVEGVDEPIDEPVDDLIAESVIDTVITETVVSEIVDTQPIIDPVDVNIVSTTVTDTIEPAPEEINSEEINSEEINSEEINSEEVASEEVVVVSEEVVSDEDTSTVFTPIAVEESETIATPSTRGTILREWWSEVSGSQIVALVRHPNYPDQPTGSEYLSQFEAPKTIGDAYGARIRGYLHPPVTGNYRFWIACDDMGELFLSTDELPINSTMRAFCPDWTHSREWSRYPEQATGEVFLEAGQRYYIEALHKEGGQKDNLAVGWQIPEQDRIVVIDGIYLSPFE